MIEVSVEARSGSASSEVAVRAQSVRRAVNLVQSRHPEGDVRIKLPIDPEVFLVQLPAAQAVVASGCEQLDEIAA